MYQKLQWHEIREQVKRVNPEFAGAVDKYNPGKDHFIYLAEYPWGQKVLDKGKLMLPNKAGQYVHIDDASLPEEVRRDLTYNRTVPFGMVLDKGMELYFKVNEFIVPYGVMAPGKLFALWVTGDPISATSHIGKTSNLISGCRTAVMGAKLSNVKKFKKLKARFKELHEPPDSLNEHWSLFKNIYDDHQSVWSSKILFFSKEWTDFKNDHEGHLRNHVEKKRWDSIHYLIDQSVFDMAFYLAISQKNRKPDPYLSDTIKHLYLMGRGAFPGFVPAATENFLPLSFLEEIFDAEYRLEFAPVMFHLDYLKPDNLVYYSLRYPTLFSFHQRKKNHYNNMDDLRQLVEIDSIVRKYLQQDELLIKDTPVYDLTKVDYRFMHNTSDTDDECHTTDIIQNLDTRIQAKEKQFNKPFSYSNQLFRGVVSMKHKSGDN